MQKLYKHRYELCCFILCGGFPYYFAHDVLSVVNTTCSNNEERCTSQHQYPLQTEFMFNVICGKFCSGYIV